MENVSALRALCVKEIIKNKERVRSHRKWCFSMRDNTFTWYQTCMKENEWCFEDSSALRARKMSRGDLTEHGDFQKWDVFGSKRFQKVELLWQIDVANLYMPLGSDIVSTTYFVTFWDWNFAVIFHFSMKNQALRFLGCAVILVSSVGASRWRLRLSCLFFWAYLWMISHTEARTEAERGEIHARKKQELAECVRFAIHVRICSWTMRYSGLWNQCPERSARTEIQCCDSGRLRYPACDLRISSYGVQFWIVHILFDGVPRSSDAVSRVFVCMYWAVFGGRSRSARFPDFGSRDEYHSNAYHCRELFRHANYYKIWSTVFVFHILSVPHTLSFSLLSDLESTLYFRRGAWQHRAAAFSAFRFFDFWEVFSQRMYT
jgi:hypothetical protein